MGARTKHNYVKRDTTTDFFIEHTKNGGNVDGLFMDANNNVYAVAETAPWSYTCTVLFGYDITTGKHHKKKGAFFYPQGRTQAIEWLKANYEVHPVTAKDIIISRLQAEQIKAVKKNTNNG